MATFADPKTITVGSKRVMIENTLGKGAFGVVHKVRNPKGTQVYALKDILCTSKGTSAIEDAFGEVEMLRQVSHDNVVQIVDSEKLRMADGVHILILTEFCSGGNLNERLDRTNSDEMAAKWIRQLASALSYLHDKNIVHRDLKPENVLLTDPRFEDIKISDFGLARNYVALKQSTEGNWINYYMDTFGGTLPWMAPEVFNQHYTEKADVFSLGCIFYAILAHQYVNVGGKRYYGAFVVDPVQGMVGLGYAMAKINPRLMVEFPRPSSRESASLTLITLDALHCRPEDRPTARALCESTASA